MSTSVARSREKTYHHGDLPSAIVEAATRILEEHGAERLSLREAARAIDVSPAAPYRHFPSREVLLAAVATRGFADLNASFAASADRAHLTPFERMLDVGRAYVDFARRRPHLFRLLFGGVISDWSLYPELKEESNRGFGIFLGTVVAAQSSGEVVDAAPDHLASTLWAGVHGYATLVLVGALECDRSPCTLDLEEFLRHVADGVRPRT